MKKILAITLLIALILPIFSLTAFAAVDNIDNAGMLNGIGGFFRDIGNLLANGFNGAIDAVKNGFSSVLIGLKNAVNAIGSFFADIAKVITDAFDAFCDFVINIFLPSKDYFPRIQLQLQTALNNKLGGIASLVGYLQERFSALKSNPSSDNMMVLEFPQGHMLGGWRIDFIRFIRPIIPTFRSLFSALMVLATALFSYRHVKGMIDS